MKYLSKTGMVAVALMFLLSLVFLPVLPEKIPMHWDAYGNVDSYMPKFPSLFLIPSLSLFLLLLFYVLPAIDPLAKNYKKFESYYKMLVKLIILFLLYMQIIIVFANFVDIRITYIILPALSLLFYFMGEVLQHSKRNWFVGIRTPWTLSNDKVWKETHKRGGKLFKAMAFVTVISIIFVNYAFYFIIASVFLVAFYLVIYSYLLFRRL